MTAVPKPSMPAPVLISGGFAGAPLGVLPFGAIFAGPTLQSAATRGATQIIAKAR